MSPDIAFSKDSVVPVRENPLVKVAEPIKDIRVETAPDLIGTDIQTYDDPKDSKFSENEDRSLQSYADSSSGKSNFSRVDAMDPLSAVDPSIKFGFGQTPTLEADTNEITNLLQKPSRGDDSKDLLQNTVPPKTTELVSVDSGPSSNPLVTEKVLKPSAEETEKPTEDNHPAVSLIKFKPNGDAENVTINVKTEPVRQNLANPEVDHFQNKLNELKARVSGNSVANQAVQTESTNNPTNYKNIFADSAGSDQSKNTSFFEIDNKQEEDVVPEKLTPEKPVAFHGVEVNPQNITKPEVAVPNQPIAKEVVVNQETPHQANDPKNNQIKNEEPVGITPVTQPLEGSAEKQVLTPKQRDESGFGGFLRGLIGLSKNPDPNSQQAHKIAQLRAEMNKE